MKRKILANARGIFKGASRRLRGKSSNTVNRLRAVSIGSGVEAELKIEDCDSNNENNSENNIVDNNGNDNISEGTSGNLVETSFLQNVADPLRTYRDSVELLRRSDYSSLDGKDSNKGSNGGIGDCASNGEYSTICTSNDEYSTICDRSSIEEFLWLIEDSNDKALEVTTKIRRVQEILKSGLKTGDGMTHLEVKNILILNYLIGLNCYFLLKLDGISVASHPVMYELAKTRLTIEKLRFLEEKLKSQTDRLVRIAAYGKAVNSNEEESDFKLKYKANLASFVPVGLEQAEDEESPDFSSGDKYVVPKIAPILTSKEISKIPRQLKNSAMKEFLEEEFGSNPLEHQLYLKNKEIAEERRELETLEEENMKRFSISKKRMRRLNDEKLQDCLEDLDELGDMILHRRSKYDKDVDSLENKASKLGIESILRNIESKSIKSTKNISEYAPPSVDNTDLMKNKVRQLQFIPKKGKK